MLPGDRSHAVQVPLYRVGAYTCAEFFLGKLAYQSAFGMPSMLPGDRSHAVEAPLYRVEAYTCAEFPCGPAKYASNCSSWPFPYPVSSSHKTGRRSGLDILLTVENMVGIMSSA